MSSVPTPGGGSVGCSFRLAAIVILTAAPVYIGAHIVAALVVAVVR